MRKFLPFVCAVLLVFLSGFTYRAQAQTWTAPTLTGSTLASGNTYYVYNVGSNGYLNRGGWWATESVVSAAPTANAAPATIIKWTAVNTSGSIWTFQYNSAGSNVAGNYLFAANTSNGDVFTDNSSDNTWNVVLIDAATNTYSIQVVSTYGGYNSAQYLGIAALAESTSKGIAAPVRYNIAGGDGYTQWKFVSQADLDLYNARVLLDRYMNYAKTRGDIDVSSYITTYNAGVTADINTAAANLLTALGRTSVTVPNYSFETDAAQAGWTNNGGFTNATNTPLFTKDGTNYTEKWTNSGSNLATGTITQTITGLANGLYGLVASGQAVQQAGSNPLHTGAFFTAGTSSTEIGSVGDYNVDYAIVNDATTGSNGTLTIGYALTGTVACNWTGFDNFRLYYYGAIVTPSLDVPVSSVTFMGSGTKKVAVTANNLSSDINITAPAHFSVNPVTLVKTVTSDSVAITYNGGTNASGYVVFTSGTLKDSVQVTGTADPTVMVTPSFLTFDELNTTATFTVTAKNLADSVRFSLPSGYSVNRKGFARDTTGAIITVTFDGLAESKGYITLTSGTASARVRVIGTLNSTKFSPLYPSGNLITDPYFNSLASYGGWGSRAITKDTTEVYCGSRSYKTTGGCGASLDYALTGKMEANTAYRLKVMTKVIGRFKFIVNGCNVKGSNDYFLDADTTRGRWNANVFSFLTGGTLAASQNLYFNSCEGYNGSLALVDNYELYKLPLYVNPASLNYIGKGTQGITIKGQILTDSISISAPAGYTVSPSKIGPNAWDTVSVAFDGVAPASGYVYVTSGSVKDSVLVTGTVEPAIVASATSLVLDDIAFKDSITVSSANLTSDLTITAPAGVTVTPSTVAKPGELNTKVLITYDKTTAVDGNIALTSGALTVNVAIKASSNASCFTPAYATGNMIADPTFSASSLSAGGFGGWGPTAITHTRQYCGRGAAYIRGTCWPNGGSIDRPLTAANGNALKPLTTYRLRAMINSQASGGKTFQFEVGGADGNNSKLFQIGNTNGWKQFDTTFVTGATVTEKGIYFNSCTNAPVLTDTCFIDNYELYEIPAPNPPVYTVDYVNETTNEVVPATDEYSVNTDMSNAVTGTDVKISLTPGQDLYYRTKASGIYPASATQTLTVPARPDAPVSPVEDDMANTFDWTNNTSFTGISDYEFSIDSGKTWVSATEKPVNVGNLDLAAGEVQVRVKATASNFHGLALASLEKYTLGTGTHEVLSDVISLYPNPVGRVLTIKNLKLPANVAILSISGEVVLQTILTDNKTDVEKLPAGIYFVKVYAEQGNCVYKFVKK
jgi:hypothetical protein